MMEGLQISIPQRMMLLRITLTFSLMISVLLSLNLWGGYRNVPYAAVVNYSGLRPPFDYLYICLAVLSWAASLFLNKQRLFIFLAFIISALLVLFDVNRLQPWFYIYSVMMAIFIFYNGRVDDSNKFTAYFIVLQIIFASVYFFCGFSQLNALFVNTEFLEIISPLKNMVSERQFQFFNKLGYITPYMLMFVGLGLIISPIRYLAITLALLMHFLLLIFLFPSSKNTNYALWLSNLSFMIMLILLFSGKTKQRYFSPTFLFQMPLFYCVIALFVIMPFFNNSEKWPDYLSSNFKSGNNTSAMISLSQDAAEKLPPELKKFCSPNYSFMIFDYNGWVREELHADCFPAKPVFNSIYNYLKKSDKAVVKEIELQMIPKQKLLLKP
jgi:hypothetical protein